MTRFIAFYSDKKWEVYEVSGSNPGGVRDLTQSLLVIGIPVNSPI